MSSPGDWPEDFSHENGNYQNLCTTCVKPFMGHKRRVQCKACQEPDVLAEIEEGLERHKPLSRSDGTFYCANYMAGCNHAPCATHRALTGWKKAEIANRQRRGEAEDALRGLTPGGSEFQTSAECVALVRADRESTRRAMLAFKLRADKAEEEKRALVEALSWAVADLKNWATRLTVRGDRTSLSNAEALLAAKEGA